MPANKGLGTEVAKRKFLEYRRKGHTVAAAAELVGRHIKTVENWRAQDAKFRQEADDIRAALKRGKDQGQDPEVLTYDFATWRKRFLGMDTYPHQQQWIDVLEGPEPTPLPAGNESVVYQGGNPKRLLINTPPFHTKSTTITQQYVAYRICMNPEVRVVIVSKTQKQAAKYLYSVKRILTEPQFRELHAAYAPQEGFKGEVWTQTMIYVNGRGQSDQVIDPAAKDPTVEAIGIGGQLQGARADLIILDDVEDPKNVAQWEQHLDWVNEVVQSRLSNGRILVVGTRVAPTDLSSALLDGDNFVSGKSPWTYLGQPCVLAFAEDPEDWITLWPRSSTPLDVEDEDVQPDENGLWPTWDGPKLNAVREGIRPRSWALLYMQQPISDDAVFNMTCVKGSVDGRRKPGPLRPGEWGGRVHGSEGTHTILSIDPAGTGEGFMLAYAVEPATGKRWVLNAWMTQGATPSWYADMLETVIPEYGVNELVIENQGYSSWLIHDERIMRYCQARGVRISPHYTSRNKLDPDFGVASMSTLFGTTRRQEGTGKEHHNEDNLIWLPDPSHSLGIKALIEQLLIWVPGKRGKDLRMDGPMALWFAETRARTIVMGDGRPPTQYLENRYLSRGAQQRRYIVPQGYTA
jgi:hypothetical protein